MTVYLYGVNRAQYDAYRANRSGPARNVTWIADATTLAAVSGSGHTIAYLCANHARPDADVIDAQIRSLVEQGKATTRQDPTGV